MITPPYIGSGGAGAQGPAGPAGATPTDAQLTALITPLIPAPVKGDTGATGPAGATPSNSSLTALIAPMIPAPIKGDTGASGPAGLSLSPGQPVSITVAFGTPQQAPDPTKPALVTVEVETSYTVTVAGNSTDEVELRVGPASAGLAAGTSGARASSTRQSLTGIALVVGLAQADRTPLTALIPAGGWFCMRRLAGTVTTINAARAVPLV